MSTQSFGIGTSFSEIHQAIRALREAEATRNATLATARDAAVKVAEMIKATAVEGVDLPRNYEVRESPSAVNSDGTAVTFLMKSRPQRCLWVDRNDCYAPSFDDLREFTDDMEDGLLGEILTAIVERTAEVNQRTVDLAAIANGLARYDRPAETE